MFKIIFNTLDIKVLRNIRFDFFNVFNTLFDVNEIVSMKKAILRNIKAKYPSAYILPNKIFRIEREKNIIKNNK